MASNGSGSASPSAPPEDHRVVRVEIVISWVLRIGVVTSLAVVVAGLVLVFAHHPDFLTSTAELPKLTRPGGVFPHTLSAVFQGVSNTGRGDRRDRPAAADPHAGDPRRRLDPGVPLPARPHLHLHHADRPHHPADVLRDRAHRVGVRTDRIPFRLDQAIPASHRIRSALRGTGSLTSNARLIYSVSRMPVFAQMGGLLVRPRLSERGAQCSSWPLM